MNHLPLLQENLELLLQHTDEVLRYSPYYYSRFLYMNENSGSPEVTAIPLGPYLEIWQQVPVNTAGKMLLTYDLVGHPIRSLFRIRQMFPDAKRLSQEDWEAESGLLYKKPLPGVSRYQLKDILRRYMLQFQKADLPVGVPFQLVIEELREAKPLQERESYWYGLLKEELRDAMADLLGVNYYHMPKEEKADKWITFQREYKTEQGPVTFRVEQEKDMQLKLLVEFAVPVKHIFYQRSHSAVALNDRLIACLNLVDPMLQENGFMKLKSFTSVSGGGLEALYIREISSPEKMLQPASLAKFAQLLQILHQAVAEQGLLPSGGINN